MAARRASPIASVGNLINYDAVSPATLAAHGLGDLTDANTRSLLSSTITSAAAVAAGFKKPYANFPDSGSVLQSLRPFPQYSGVGQFQAPLGDSWYDSLQVKVVKRLSHGLTATMAYTFGKALDSTTNAGSIYDRSTFKGLSPNYYPHIFSLSVDYTVPAIGPVKRSRIARAILADWRITSLSTNQSGQLLATPTSSNSIGSYVSTGYTRMVRVPGVPLYLKDVNCGCIDPTQETVLNPAAWQNQAPGVPGSNVVYYNDFRAQRRPAISGGIGKVFRIREGVCVQRPRGVLQSVQHAGIAGESEHGKSAEPGDAVEWSAHRRLRIPQLYGDRGQQREFLVAHSPHRPDRGAHPVLRACGRWCRTSSAHCALQLLLSRRRCGSCLNAAVHSL